MLVVGSHADLPATASVAIGLNDDLVDAGSFADRRHGKWADAYAAVGASEAMFAGV
jgi:hypothetical protein